MVLFTSGTEGKPKGVVLSHANLVSNARQVFALADGILSERDIFMNPLPAFHSFGLTAGMLVPLFHGMKVVLYPSPLHYKQVPKLIRDTGCTFLLSTDTFLQGYAPRCGSGRPEIGALRRRRSRAGEAADTRDVGALWHHDPRRLWLHRMFAGDGLQHAHGDRAATASEAALAGHRGEARTGRGHHRGRPTQRARTECHGRLSQHRGARRDRAAGRRLARHRRYRRDR